MTSTYINSISRVKTRKLSIRFCEWICQLPTWRRRYCFDILATRMTWRYISHNSLLSGLSFRHSNNHLWRVTCHGNVPLLLSFVGPLLHPALTQSRQLTNFAYSQFRKTTLCLWVNLMNTEYVNIHTHTNADPHNQLLRLVPLGVAQMYWLCWFQATRKTSENIEDRLCALLCLGSFATCTERVWSFSSCPFLSFSTILTIRAAFPNDINIIISTLNLTCQAAKNSE